MKLFYVIIFISLSLYSCSTLNSSPITKRKPGNLILSNNKNSVKENMKYYKEQAKAAQKKREELESCESETRPDQFNKKKKSQKR